MVWIDLFILVTLLFPAQLANFGFLRVLRLWTLVESDFFWRTVGRRYDDTRVEEVTKAAIGLLTFADEIRPCASEGGFGGIRTKVLDTLGQRIDQYVEDVLEQMRLGDVDKDDDRAREYLDVAARLLTLARDKKSGAIVRRRAAAA